MILFDAVIATSSNPLFPLFFIVLFKGISYNLSVQIHTKLTKEIAFYCIYISLIKSKHHGKPQMELKLKKNYMTAFNHILYNDMFSYRFTS